LVSRVENEKLLNQNAVVVWLTGISRSGKTTLAEHIEIALYEKGFLSQLLDGDAMRLGGNKNLGFSDPDREENIRRGLFLALFSIIYLGFDVEIYKFLTSP
jgi:adenylylsulfate kinase